MSITGYIVNKGLKLKFNTDRNTWSIIEGTKVLHLGTEKQCMSYLKNLKLA